ncbi:MAG: YraN family protein [Ferruginibacter sp.]
MAKHNRTGKEGEELAAVFLSRREYIIMHRNWRHGHWEVDIIAEKKGILHFIEVKTRRTSSFGHPEENVSIKKIQNLLNAAENFLYQNPQWKRVQFDILSLTLLKGEPAEYFLIEDVYL